jgi:hypothetical protein
MFKNWSILIDGTTPTLTLCRKSACAFDLQMLPTEHVQLSIHVHVYMYLLGTRTYAVVAGCGRYGNNHYRD